MTADQQSEPNPDALLFDTSPKAVRRWIEALPIANVGESTRTIYEVLGAVNARGDVPTKERFGLLLALGEPLRVLLPALERYFAYQPYPVPYRAWRVAKLTIDLQKRLATGWRKVLESPAPSWLQQKSHEQMLLAASHHLMECYEGLLCSYRMAAIAYPHGLWRNLYRLYVAAVKHKRHTVELESSRGGDERSSIELLFRRVLLLALLSPQKLGRQRMEEVKASLPLWLPLLQLVEVSAESGLDLPGAPYCVLLDQDHSPTMPTFLHAEERRGKALLLRTAPIAEKLEGLLADSRRTRFILLEEERKYVLSRQVLNALLVNWCRPPERDGARQPISGAVDVTVGLRGLHVVLGGAAAQGGDEEPVFNDADGSNWVDDIDVEAAYRPCAAEVLDSSPNGCRLRLDAADIDRVAVGDLLGIRNDPDGPWFAASVRWLSEEPSRRVQLGVQMIGRDCEAVWVRVSKPGVSDARVGALYGRDRDGNPVLMLPNVGSYDEAKLVLERAGETLPVRLTTPVTESPTMEASYFAEERPQRPQPKAPEANKREVTEPAKPFDDDEYAALWKSL